MDSEGFTDVVKIVSGVSAAGAGTIFWFLFQSARKEAAAAKSAVIHIKESCKAGITDIRGEIAAYKLHVAEKYVTQEALTKSVTSLERAIDRVCEMIEKNAAEQRNSLDSIHRRIDQKVDK
jgi:hypothetical protein